MAIGDKKICPACGKEFIQTRTRQKYCDSPHYKPCPICGKLILMKYPGDPAPACSPECRSKLRALHKAQKNDEIVQKEKELIVSESKTEDIVTNVSEKKESSVAFKEIPTENKEKPKTVPLFNLNQKPSDIEDLKGSQHVITPIFTHEADTITPEVSTTNSDEYERTSNRASPLKITLKWDDDEVCNSHHVVYQYHIDVMGFKKNQEYDIDIIRNPVSKHYGYVIKAVDSDGNEISMPTSSFIMINRYFRLKES